MDKNRIKNYCYDHLATIFWSFFLVVGGAVFVSYYAYIGYMPNFDFSSSVAITAAAGVTGIILLIFIMFLMIFPGAFWINTWGSESQAKDLWTDSEGNATFKGLLLWFLIPVFVIYVGVYLAFNSGWYGWLIPPLIFIIYYLYLKFWRSNIDSPIKEVGKQFCTTLLSSVFLIFPLWMAVGLSTSNGDEKSLSPFFVGLISVLFVLFINIMVAAKPKNFNAFVWYVGLAFLTVFMVFSMSNSFYMIPQRVIEIYKFGNIKVSKIVLEEEACKSFRALGVEVEKSKEVGCVAKDIIIMSRLGEEMYLKNRESGNPLNFTIDSSNVLSWSTRGIEKE